MTGLDFRTLSSELSERRVKGSYLASESGTIIGGLPRAACCPPRSSDTPPPPRRWTLPGPAVSLRSSPSLLGLGVGLSSQSFGVGCSTAPSALALPWSTLAAARCGSCPPPASRSSSSKDRRGSSFSSSPAVSSGPIEGGPGSRY